MPLISTNNIPPGGFVYTQKDNAGKVVKVFKSMSPWNEIRKEILDCRVGNHFSRATVGEVDEDLHKENCERLGFDPNWCTSQKKTFQFQPVRIFKASTSHLRQVAGVVVEAVGKLNVSAKIISQWLGSGGKPVNADLAQSRANVCLRGAVDGAGSMVPCPFNKPGAKPIEAAAKIIKGQLEAKAELKLIVQGEENLHTCDRCWCFLPTKIFCPIEHIVENTPASMLNKLSQDAPWCWQVKEAQSPP